VKESTEKKNDKKKRKVKELQVQVGGGYRPYSGVENRAEIELAQKSFMEMGFLREHNAEFTLSREKGGRKTFHSLVLTRGVYSTSARLLCTLKDPGYPLTRTWMQAFFFSREKLCIVFQPVRFILTRNRCTRAQQENKRGCYS